MEGDGVRCPQHGEHEWRLRAVEETVKEIPDIKERMTSAEASSKSAHHRLDSQEEQTRAIVKMGVAVEQMAKETKETIALLKEHDGRLYDLERVPGEAVLKSIEGLATRIEALEKAPGEEALGYARLAKKKVVDLLTAAAVGAVLTLFGLLALAPKLIVLAGRTP